jgi:hypothetical protein
MEGGFGLWAVCLTRMGSRLGIRWGQGLFLAALVILGVTTMLAAYWHAFALTPLGLCTGLLVAVGVFESPRSTPAVPESTPFLVREQYS